MNEPKDLDIAQGQPGSPDDHDLLRTALDHLLEGVQVVSRDYRYLYVNDTVVRHGRIAREALLGRTMMECYPGIEDTVMFATLRRCMEEREHAQLENEFTFPDGSPGWFELRFAPVPEGVAILSVDITARRQAEAARKRAEAALEQAQAQAQAQTLHTEEQLVASQHLEAVGRLAGGVAHDFNNLLSVILTYTGFAIELLDESDPMREDIEQAHEAGRRAAELTKQLLAFSRKQILEPRATNLNDVLGGLEGMLRRLLGEDIDIKVTTAEDLGSAMADPGQLEQVIMNLAVNARDAMPRGGRLTIETANVELDAEYAEQHIAVTPGRYVRLSMSDTGEGMSDETQSRIFEPFYTTKEKGKGTGLGLSTVYGIVKQSGGNVWVYSEPGRGTTFKVYLPRVDAAAVDYRRSVSADAPGGTETILFVEDEDAVRRAGERILRAAGYQVVTAAHGGEALDLCERHDGPIDLLLTDVVMPRMSGRELAEQLAARRPGLRVLYTSGYTDDAIVHHGVLDAGTRFIGKPFSVAELRHKVRHALDE